MKIAPGVQRARRHVLDASRAVDVVSSLLATAARRVRSREPRAEQAEIREQYARGASGRCSRTSAARANRLRSTGTNTRSPSPWFVGRRYLDDVPLAEIAQFIDWTFFFSAWELKGRFPAILEHPQYGAGGARALRQRAGAARSHHRREAAHGARRLRLLAGERRRRRHRRLTPTTRGGRAGALPRCCGSRRSSPTAAEPSLADFVAPRESGVPDYIGVFAVTAGIGADELVRRFEQDHDDYNAIMVKALADRLAEAFAEYLHAQARKDWGYGERERCRNEDLIAEKYRGIRPAYGYPACPDHSEKFKLFELLDAPRQGITLTEHAAMLPAASVSGLYFSHPQAKYFNVGRIGRDQIESSTPLDSSTRLRALCQRGRRGAALRCRRAIPEPVVAPQSAGRRRPCTVTRRTSSHGPAERHGRGGPGHDHLRAAAVGAEHDVPGHHPADPGGSAGRSPAI